MADPVDPSIEAEEAPPSAGQRPGITLAYSRAIAAARNPALTMSHKAVLWAITMRFYREPECWPSGDLLAADAGASRGGLYDLLNDLCSWGIVRRWRPRRGRPSTTFTVDLDRLATTDTLAPSPKRQRVSVETTPNRSPSKRLGVSVETTRGVRRNDSGCPRIGHKEIREEYKEEATEEISTPTSGAGTTVAPSVVDGGTPSAGHIEAEAGETSAIGQPSTLPLFGEAAAVTVAKPPKRRKVAPPPSPKQAKPDPAELCRPVWAAYREAYAAAHNGAQPPPPDGGDNTMMMKLVNRLGPEDAERLIREALALPRVRSRYSTIRKIAQDPAAVRAAIAEQTLQAVELAEAEDIMNANPDNALCAAIRAERRQPTRDELYTLRRIPRRYAGRSIIVQQPSPDGPLTERAMDF